MNILGTFSKGTDGAKSLNFGQSGGKNCDKRCIGLINGDCYAITVEARGDRKPLLAKLQRHELMPAAQVCGMALLELQSLELQDKLPTWFRFSTNGSLPQPEDIDPLFVTQLRTLVAWLVDREIDIHFPVETNDKACTYREIVGDLLTVRESLQRPGEHLTTQGAVSWVAG